MRKSTETTSSNMRERWKKLRYGTIKLLQQEENVIVRAFANEFIKKRGWKYLEGRTEFCCWNSGRKSRYEWEVLVNCIMANTISRMEVKIGRGKWKWKILSLYFSVDLRMCTLFVCKPLYVVFSLAILAFDSISHAMNGRVRKWQ